MTEENVAPVADAAAPEPEKFSSISERPRRTDEELKQIAVDLLARRIFTDRHFRSDEEWDSMVGSVFMVINFMSRETREDLAKHCAMIFEYLDKASSRGVNGYPSFMSMQIIRKDEIERLMQYYEALKTAQAGVTLPPEAVPS